MLIGPICKICAGFGGGISHEILLRSRILLVVEENRSLLKFLNPGKGANDPLSISGGKGKNRKRAAPQTLFCKSLLLLAPSSP